MSLTWTWGLIFKTWARKVGTKEFVLSFGPWIFLILGKGWMPYKACRGLGPFVFLLLLIDVYKITGYPILYQKNRNRIFPKLGFLITEPVFYNRFLTIF